MSKELIERLRDGADGVDLIYQKVENITAKMENREPVAYILGSDIGEVMRQASTRLERYHAALSTIAAEACVSIADLPGHGQPNGWRKIAVERIDIAREALK